MGFLDVFAVQYCHEYCTVLYYNRSMYYFINIRHTVLHSISEQMKSSLPRLPSAAYVTLLEYPSVPTGCGAGECHACISMDLVNQAGRAQAMHCLLPANAFNLALFTARWPASPITRSIPVRMVLPVSKRTTLRACGSVCLFHPCALATCFGSMHLYLQFKRHGHTDRLLMACASLDIQVHTYKYFTSTSTGCYTQILRLFH